MTSEVPQEPLSLAFSVGELSFILARLLQVRQAVEYDLRFATLQEKEGRQLRQKLLALNTVISLLRQGHKKKLMPIPEQCLVISENEDGVNGAYLCDDLSAAILTEALLETEHLVTRYLVLPDEKEPFTVYEIATGVTP